MQVSRRSFLKRTAAAAAVAPWLVPSRVWAAETQPSSRLTMGFVGLGTQGRYLLGSFLGQDTRVLAVCDVDTTRRNDAKRIVDEHYAKQSSQGGCAACNDFREIVNRQDIDAVCIATPDHWHAIVTLAALRSGKDVYCEKPLTHNIHEAVEVLRAVDANRRVLQTGSMQRSMKEFRVACELVQNGAIGRVERVVCSFGGPPVPCDLREERMEPGLDWNFWVGPAPMRPFNELIHPRGWRGFMEYSNGIVGDMCVHMFDMVRWMLDRGWPKRISSSGGILVAERGKTNIADTQTATFDFGDLDVVWQHRTWGDPTDPKYPWGATFYGDKGTLKASVMGYDFTPIGPGDPVHADVKYEFDEFPEDRTEKDLERHVAPALRGHMKDFLAACATRGRPVADIEEGYISTTSCILANLAMRLGRTLTWDAKLQRVVDDDEANRLLRRPYRQPWIHPEPEA